MGVGNYMFRHTKLARTALSFSAIAESFEDALKRNFDELKTYLTNNPDQVPAGLDISNFDANELPQLCETLGEEVWSDVVDQDVLYGEQSYYQSKSEQSFEDMQNALAHRLSEHGVLLKYQKPSEHPYSNRDAYTVIAEGDFCDVGIKEWESDYFIGVQPNYNVDNYEKTIEECNVPANDGIQKLIASLAVVVNDDPLLKQVAGDLANSVTNEAQAFVREKIYSPSLVSNLPNELVEQARLAIESEAEQKFEQMFGMPAGDVYAMREQLDLITEVWDQVGHMPKAIDVGYMQEFAKLELAIKHAAFDCSNDVYSSDGGYTSSRVERPEPLEPLMQPQQDTAELSNDSPAP